ncbi:sulfotransferase 1C2 [Trichonephila inaurata madagascariensis]|uniref:Sulfotransferase 1C2 n=1 Tax=Trichonephila inaurata madagascariensis TaxID=2747483 RepID=A0A8X6XCZ5_9ARAC|nr:sulfotransferase 1C2 [Trichonephila inaurata madagascariensis]
MSSDQENTSKAQKPKIPFYQDVDGFKIPGFFSAEAYKSALAYKPKPDDLFIVTYPKCGTTWVQNIVASIFRDGRPFQSALEFFTETPFLEMAGAQAAENMKRPGAIKFHLPYHMTPQSPDAKYIFVARNPKDCCVSFYHHAEGIPGYQFEGGEFDVFFELFMNGEVEFGDYFDCVLSWYEHRNDPNVLFITYEELKKDIKSNALKIAQFIGPQYKRKKEVFANDFKMAKKGTSDVTFVRKGIIGDWRNYFSPTQNARLEKRFRERTAGTDLHNLWKDDM